MNRSMACSNVMRSKCPSYSVVAITGSSSAASTEVRAADQAPSDTTDTIAPLTCSRGFRASACRWADSGLTDQSRDRLRRRPLLDDLYLITTLSKQFDTLRHNIGNELGFS
jgi:hypothetical protein